jgi:hypothetical protein
MRVLTIKSADTLDRDRQLEVHYVFGMEKHTDYVFKPRENDKYSATIVLEDTQPVVAKIILESKSFPDHAFVIDDLDMENNSIKRYHVKDGHVKEQLRT